MEERRSLFLPKNYHHGASSSTPVQEVSAHSQSQDTDSSSTHLTPAFGAEGEAPSPGNILPFQNLRSPPAPPAHHQYHLGSPTAPSQSIHPQTPQALVGDVLQDTVEEDLDALILQGRVLCRWRIHDLVASHNPAPHIQGLLERIIDISTAGSISLNEVEEKTLLHFWVVQENGMQVLMEPWVALFDDLPDLLSLAPMAVLDSYMAVVTGRQGLLEDQNGTNNDRVHMSFEPGLGASPPTPERPNAQVLERMPLQNNAYTFLATNNLATAAPTVSTPLVAGIGPKFLEYQPSHSPTTKSFHGNDHYTRHHQAALLQLQLSDSSATHTEGITAITNHHQPSYIHPFVLPLAGKYETFAVTQGGNTAMLYKPDLIPPAPHLLPRPVGARDCALVVSRKRTGPTTIKPLTGVLQGNFGSNRFLRAIPREEPYSKVVPWRSTKSGDGGYAMSLGRVRILMEHKPLSHLSKLPPSAFSGGVHPLDSRVAPACLRLTWLGDLQPSLVELLSYAPLCTINREISIRLQSARWQATEIRRFILMVRGITDPWVLSRDRIAHQEKEARDWRNSLDPNSRMAVPHYTAGEMSTERGSSGTDEDYYLVDFARGLEIFPTVPDTTRSTPDTTRCTDATEWTDAIAHAVTHGHIYVKMSEIQTYLDKYGLRHAQPARMSKEADIASHVSHKAAIWAYGQNVLKETTKKK